MTIDFEKVYNDRLELAVRLNNALIEEIEDVISIHADGPFAYFIYRDDLVSETHEDNKDVYTLDDGMEITIIIGDEYV